MLAMAQQEYIKFLRDDEGLSINKIAKQMKVNWRTAKNTQTETIGMSR